MDQPPPIAAATLILMREDGAGPPAILVVERAAGMAFAGGAMVFPGGRIDAADVALAADLGRPQEAAKITAIRETIEESAVLAGVRSAAGPIDPAHGAVLQRALLAGVALGPLLRDHGLDLALDLLVPIARWIPGFKQARRFDTIFFVAAALPGDWPPLPQPGECQSAEWAGAQALLDRLAAGDAHAIFPTKRTLERIARFASFGEARADAALYPLDPIVPWVEQRGGHDHVCIPADRGYPVTSEPLTSAVRA